MKTCRWKDCFSVPFSLVAWPEIGLVTLCEEHTWEAEALRYLQHYCPSPSQWGRLATFYLKGHPKAGIHEGST